MTNFSSALAELQETQKIIERFTTSLGIEESSADLPFAQKVLQLLSKLRILKSKENFQNQEDDYRSYLMRSLQRYQNDYNSKKAHLDSVCSFTTSELLDFLSAFLEECQHSSFTILNTPESIILRETKNGNQISFSNEPQINLFDNNFLAADNPLYQAYPFLYQILLELVNYRMKHSFDDSIVDETEAFKYMTLVLPFTYQSIINDSETKVAPGLIPFAKELCDNLAHNPTLLKYFNINESAAFSFLEPLKKGLYNPLISQKYWFSKGLNIWDMVSWHESRKEFSFNNPNLQDITMENYLVYKALNQIFSHIKDIHKKGSYYISLNGHTQTPASSEEITQLEELKKSVLTKNYSWRESREILRNISRLSIYTDYHFPHNVDEIIKAFNPNIITYYDKIATNINLQDSETLTNIRNRANSLLNNLNADTLVTYFSNPNQDSIDEYIKRMILSMLDVPTISFNNNQSSFKNALECFHEELSTSSTISKSACELLFCSKASISLAAGVLKSLCFNGKISNILNECFTIQKDLNCNRGTVGYNDVNTLRLPDGSVIYSTYVEDIKPQYERFQEAYNFYYQNCSDLEFVENIIELFGDVTLTQIFREGNKRTAKCLFNKMLLSRGIIPPIADLNENERELWNSIAYGRFNRYPDAKKRLLSETIQINELLKDPSLTLPTNVSLEAYNRKEFQSRGYY